MATCPSGHDSGTPDFCDVCGIRITGGATPAATPDPAASGAPATGGSPAGSTGAGAAGGATCPACGEALTARFCESCGFDRENPAMGGGAVPVGTGGDPVPDGTGGANGTAPSAASAWVAVVGVDRPYYERVMAELGSDPGELPFPAYTPERRVPLTGPHVRIGRRSASGGFVPEIDASRPPEDPAVSHEHAVLLPKPDGSWVLVDLGSTNGTTVGDTAAPVEANVEVPLHEGDRVYVGAWTVVTVVKA